MVYTHGLITHTHTHILGFELYSSSAVIDDLFKIFI